MSRELDGCEQPWMLLTTLMQLKLKYNYCVCNLYINKARDTLETYGAQDTPGTAK